MAREARYEEGQDHRASMVEEARDNNSTLAMPLDGIAK